jgi:ketosteroid isomerase-like protein
MSDRNVAVVLRGAELFNAGHVDSMIDELWAVSAVYADHRPIGWETMNREQVRELNRSAFSVVQDIHRETEVVAHPGDAVVCRVRFTGHAVDGGGEVELEYAEVTVLRDGLIVQRDIYADLRTALSTVGDVRPKAQPGPSPAAGRPRVGC